MPFRTVVVLALIVTSLIARPASAVPSQALPMVLPATVPIGANSATAASDVLPPTPENDEQVVRFLNAQRAMNGFSSGLVASPEMSVGCAKHNNYMRQHGLTHYEDPGKPGYTPEGALAGARSVLSYFPHSGWDTAWVNPWAHAPLHWAYLFGPTATTAGYAYDGVFMCLQLGGDVDVPASTYSVPGNGTSGVPVAMNAEREIPYSPNRVAGVPEDQAGFNIILIRAGPGTREVASASLTSAGRPVDIRIVDSRSSVPGGGTWPYSESFLVPTRHLAYDEQYDVEVTFTDGAVHHSTFRTEPRPAASYPAATVKVKAVKKKSKLRVDVNPNKGRGYWKLKVQKQRASGSWKSLKTYRTKGSKETRTINLKKGTYRVVVRPKYGYEGVTSASVYLRK